MSIEGVLNKAAKLGLKSRSWRWQELKAYNGFTHTQRVRKWQAMDLAVRMGLIPPADQFPCSICGQSQTEVQINYHSEDYSKLDGHYPLCKSCHSHLHLRFKNPKAWEEHINKFTRPGQWFHQLSMENKSVLDKSLYKRAINERTEVRTVLSVVQSYGFPDFKQVTNRLSISDLYPERKRSGIYILYFADSAFYIGVSIDVTNRYVQHRLIHRDIEAISFIQCPEQQHRAKEKELIHLLEGSKVRLRNIEHASIPKGQSDIDEVVSLDEQKHWLDDMLFEEIVGERIVDNELYYRYQRLFNDFQRLPEAGKTLDFLADYVKATILYPKKTEIIFWALTCLPRSSYKLKFRQPALARMNLGRQEVLTICRNLQLEDKYFDDACIFYVAKTPIEKSYPDGIVGAH